MAASGSRISETSGERGLDGLRREADQLIPTDPAVTASRVREPAAYVDSDELEYDDEQGDLDAGDTVAPDWIKTRRALRCAGSCESWSGCTGSLASARDIPALAWYLLSSLVPLALGLTALAAVALGDYCGGSGAGGACVRRPPGGRA